MLLSRRTLLLGGAGLSLSGCGGGDTSIYTTRVRPRVAIRWAARSRALSGPSAALFAEITVRPLAVPETPVSMIAFRELGTLNATTQIYELPRELPTGTVELTVRFYEAKEGYVNYSLRVLVAIAQQQVALTSPTGLLPDVAVEGLIASVSLAAGQVIPVGGRSNLTFSAQDTSGNLLALGPGAAFLEIVEGDGTVLSREVDTSFEAGALRGLAAGTARVRVRVNELVSAPVDVTVSRILPLSQGGSLALVDAQQLLWDPTRQKLWFASTSPVIANTLQSLDFATRTFSTPVVIPGGGLFDLVFSADASVLYGYSYATRAILKIRPSDGAILERIILPPNNAGGRPKIFPLPGPPNRLLVSWINSSSQEDVWIYDGTTPRPLSLRSTLADPTPYFSIYSVSTNDDGTVAYIGMGTTGWQVSIGPEGFVGPALAIPGGYYNQGQLVDPTGRVSDAASGALLGALVTPYTPNRYMGILANRSYVALEETYGMNVTIRQLRVIAPAKLQTQATLTLPAALPATQDFTITQGIYTQDILAMSSWGEHGLAVLYTNSTSSFVPTRLVLYDSVAGL